MNKKKSKIDQPRIMKKMPGPKVRELIWRDRAVMSTSYTRSYPMVIHRGRGMWVTDPDGNRFLDFTAGLAVTSTGHCHPKVVKAIQRQAEQFIHLSGTDFYYQPQVDLAEKLASLAPIQGKKRVFFTNSGAESVEAAFKLARYKTGRERMISFYGAFHGRTFGALSLTGSKVRQREKFGSLVPGVTHVNYPYLYRFPHPTEPGDEDLDCVDYIEQVVFKKTVPPKDVAAIIVEPIQGEGGYIVPPPQFHPKLRKLTEKYGILLIMDEVQSGMGRTGKMFAIEHWNVKPDMITVAKGIASGMPLGALIARADLMDWEPGSHANTFGGNPLCCAAALETIRLIENQYMKNARLMGEYLKTLLWDLYKRHPLIGDVRGLGLMAGVEIVKNRQTKEMAIKERDQIVQNAFDRGLLILGCGDTSIRFSPPLIVNRQEMKTAVQIFEAALTAVEKKF